MTLIPDRIRVIDSHTGGEPTRVVVDGLPNLGAGSMAERCAILERDFRVYRSAVVNEPRGSEIIVGALLFETAAPGCDVGVIFFNNVGVLGMCGHGTIGVVATLAHLGRIRTGTVTLDTPAGVVAATLDGGGRVALRNVRSWRIRKDVAIDVPGYGSVSGDIAWGGNWFFLVHHHREELVVENADHLTDVTWRIRQALRSSGVTGAGGAEIDHIELFGPPADPRNDGRNFVLCPGKAYDRSPCGTGTSAKLACLYADGRLAPGQIWRQESIIGSVFEGSVEPDGEGVIPTIRGDAFVTAESTLVIDPRDPFRYGVRL